MSVELNFKIKIKDKELSLTQEEARLLYSKLSELFQKENSPSPFYPNDGINKYWPPIPPVTCFGDETTAKKQVFNLSTLC